MTTDRPAADSAERIPARPVAPWGPRVVLACLAATLAAMFVISFVQRLTKPSLQVAVQPQHDLEGDQDKQMMDMMGKMMRKMGENPDDPQIPLQLGEAFLQQKNWDMAERFLNRALVMQPSDVKTLDLLAMTMNGAGRHAEALDYYARISAVEPANAPARFNMGILKGHYLGKTDEAVAHFEEVLAMDSAEPGMKQSAREQIVEVQQKAKATAANGTATPAAPSGQ